MTIFVHDHNEHEGMTDAEMNGLLDMLEQFYEAGQRRGVNPPDASSLPSPARPSLSTGGNQ